MCCTNQHTQSSFQQFLCWLRSIVWLYLAASSPAENEWSGQSRVRSQVHEPRTPSVGLLHKSAIPGLDSLWCFGSRCGYFSFDYEQSIQRPLRTRRFLESCKPAAAPEPVSKSNMSSCGTRQRLRCLCQPHSFRINQQQPNYGYICSHHDGDTE